MSLSLSWRKGNQGTERESNLVCTAELGVVRASAGISVFLEML
jgi:hypothetical protein